MRRRWVAALVLATALVFLVAGTALGYWVIESKGESAACIAYRGGLERGDSRGISFEELIELYDEFCS